MKLNLFLFVLTTLIYSTAWTHDINKKEPIIVAVIDTGIDINHPLFKNMLWMNPGEVGLDKTGKSKTHNKIDDDENGFVDDVYGWDFVTNTPFVQDTMGHGTHVSGIIAGKHSVLDENINEPQVLIMTLKYYSPNQGGLLTLKNSIKSFEYAIKMGAQIINYSGGGIQSSSEEEAVLKLALEKNIIVVAAAGNEKSLADNSPYYPASYHFENIISVAANDNKNNLAKFSNYGVQNVDISAPGVEIYSSLPNNKFGRLSGTSQATAFVSYAVSKVLKEKNVGVRPKDIVDKIYFSRNYVESLKDKTRFQGVLNITNLMSVKSESQVINGVYVKTIKNSKYDFRIKEGDLSLFLE